MKINPQNLSLTLFVSVLISLAVSSVEAHDFAQPNRRDHDNLKRLIRKRSPQLGAIVNAVGNPNATPDPNAGGDAGGDAAASATALSASAQSASASATVASDSASASASESASNSASAVSLSASDSASASNSASASSVAPSSSSAPASKSSADANTPAVQTPAPNTPDPNTNQNTASHSQATVTKVNSVVANAAETNASPPQQQSASAEKKSTITTILIVVAASVGGVAILWTVFRKWKLGHSKKFDERMAPIDWQPTNDDGIVPAHRRANSRASSFNSSAHGNGTGYSDRLEHDFTAAPSHLAPVGGYADLARGPSPQPQMQEAYGQGLARGPSTTRPAYDTGVPLHHQAGYGQAEAYDYNGNAVRF